MSDETKIMLSEKEIPQAWYNIQADLPNPPVPTVKPRNQATGRS
jgi:tryptophan synthase beta chain